MQKLSSFHYPFMHDLCTFFASCDCSKAGTVRKGLCARWLWSSRISKPHNGYNRTRAPPTARETARFPIASRRVRAALRDALHRLRLGLQLLELPPRVVGVKARDVR